MQTFSPADRARGLLLGAMVASLLCAATTCDSPVRFEVRGDLKSGVAFRVYDAQKEDRQVQADQVVVGELHGDEIWRLEGHAAIRELWYGKPIEGLTSTLEPHPLERGKSYYIVVQGGDRWRGGYYGSFAFAVDIEGRVGPAPLKVGEVGSLEE